MKRKVYMLNYFKEEKVLTISFILAIISMFFVRPDATYMEYIDLHVLALLFCLMLLVKGFQEMGLFDVLIEKAFGKIKSSRNLGQVLIFLCFFTSMLITNDVALITFVPFAIMALQMCHQEKLMIKVIVLQTIAANLGSMLTPIGNPQNLYLYTTSGMSLGEFFSAILPLAAVSLVLLAVSTLLIPNNEIHMTLTGEKAKLEGNGLFLGYLFLFMVNMLVVLHIISWIPATIATIAGVMVLGKKHLIKEVDFSLLLTFIGFFIFVGNLGRIEFINELIATLIQSREVFAAAMFSQVLSNVPAAILLSGFTEDFASLIIGTNIGGLGTLIASMASLISYKLYAQHETADTGRYLLVFTGYNVIGLAVLLIFFQLAML